MKILLIAYACEPNRGSELGVGWNWAYHLAKMGHEVWVLTRPNGRESIGVELSKHLHLNIHFEYIDIPVKNKKFIHGQIGVYLHYLIWQQSALQKAYALDMAFDIVHHVTWSGVFGGSVFWKLGLPFIYGPCGGGQVTPTQFFNQFGMKFQAELLRNIIIYSLPFEPANRSFLKNSNIVLVTNEETYRFASKGGARNIKLFLDSGISEDYLPQSIPNRGTPEKLRVLWVARLYPRKGLRLALESINKTRIPIQLTIVGNGPLGSQVQNLIKKYELEEKVEWWGQVPWVKVKEAYESNDVFLFTSIRESFGGQLLEAAAYGLPIVTLDHNGAKSFLPDTSSIKVPVKSINQITDDIAFNLEELWKHPDKRIQMGMASYEFAKSQTWDRRAAKLIELYEQVLKR